MPSLKIAGVDVENVQVGSTEVQAVYVGSTKIWTRTLINPETGWDSTYSDSESNSGANYSNAVSITTACTLKITTSVISMSASSQNSNSTFLEVNTGSGWPTTGGSPYYWGNGGASNPNVAWGTTKTLNFSAGDQIRFMYWNSFEGGEVNVTSTVRNNSDNSVVDTGIVGYHIWDYDE